MFSQFPKKTLFSKLISGIVAVSFILTSVPVRSYADLGTVDKLRRPAGNDQKTLEDFRGDLKKIDGKSGEVKTFTVERSLIFGPKLKIDLELVDNIIWNIRGLTINGITKTGEDRTFTSGKLLLKDVLADQVASDSFIKKFGDLPVYTMYRDIFLSEADNKVIRKNGLRCDITLILPYKIGEEPNKTYGHYHPEIAGTGLSYTEVYVVLSGEAIYYLQKVDDQGNVVDAIQINAKAGDIVPIPANYGHITVNPSPDKPLVMMNWVDRGFDSVYGEITKLKGGAYYFVEKDGKVTAILNPAYQKANKTIAALRKVAVSSDAAAEIGLPKGQPVYDVINRASDLEKLKLFLSHPEKLSASLVNRILGLPVRSSGIASSAVGTTIHTITQTWEEFEQREIAGREILQQKRNLAKPLNIAFNIDTFAADQNIMLFGGINKIFGSIFRLLDGNPNFAPAAIFLGDYANGKPSSKMRLADFLRSNPALGNAKYKVELQGDQLIINGRKIALYNNLATPEELKKLNVDVLIEATKQGYLDDIEKTEEKNIEEKQQAARTADYLKSLPELKVVVITPEEDKGIDLVKIPLVNRVNTASQLNPNSRISVLAEPVTAVTRLMSKVLDDAVKAQNPRTKIDVAAIEVSRTDRQGNGTTDKIERQAGAALRKIMNADPAAEAKFSGRVFDTAVRPGANAILLKLRVDGFLSGLTKTMINQAFIQASDGLLKGLIDYKGRPTASSFEAFNQKLLVFVPEETEVQDVKVGDGPPYKIVVLKGFYSETGYAKQVLDLMTELALFEGNIASSQQKASLEVPKGTIPATPRRIRSQEVDDGKAVPVVINNAYGRMGINLQRRYWDDSNFEIVGINGVREKKEEKEVTARLMEFDQVFGEAPYSVELTGDEKHFKFTDKEERTIIINKDTLTLIGEKDGERVYKITTPYGNLLVQLPKSQATGKLKIAMKLHGEDVSRMNSVDNQDGTWTIQGKLKNGTSVGLTYIPGAPFARMISAGVRKQLIVPITNVRPDKKAISPGKKETAEDFFARFNPYIKTFAIKVLKEMPYLNKRVLFDEASGELIEHGKVLPFVTGGAGIGVISAPAKATIPNMPAANLSLLPGVNTEAVIPVWDLLQTVSCTSCTTNAAATGAKALLKVLFVVSGHFSTIHAVTNTQGSQFGDILKNITRSVDGRGNIVYETTGASTELGKAITGLLNTISGVALRVGNDDGSLVNYDFQVIPRDGLELPTAEEINRQIKLTTETPEIEGGLKGSLGYAILKTSLEVVGQEFGGVFDPSLTKVNPDTSTVSIGIHYDNERGYVNQYVTLNLLLALQQREVESNPEIIAHAAAKYTEGKSGASTGRVSVENAKKAGATGVFIGSGIFRSLEEAANLNRIASKRVDVNGQVNAGLKKALEAGLTTPIFNVYITKEAQISNTFIASINRQIAEGLKDVSPEELVRVTVSLEAADEGLANFTDYIQAVRNAISGYVARSFDNDSKLGATVSTRIRVALKLNNADVSEDELQKLAMLSGVGGIILPSGMVFEKVNTAFQRINAAILHSPDSSQKRSELNMQINPRFLLCANPNFVLNEQEMQSIINSGVDTYYIQIALAPVLPQIAEFSSALKGVKLTKQEIPAAKVPVRILLQNAILGNREGFVNLDEMANHYLIHDVLFNHSEIVDFTGISPEEIARTLKRAHALKKQGKITGNIVVAVGETETDYQTGVSNSKDIVLGKVRQMLQYLTPEEVADTIIAYEPIWAISTGLGTGNAATSKYIQEMHANIRSAIKAKYGRDTSEKIRIIYGGTGKPENAEEIMGLKDVDGLLPGGASTKLEDFRKIVAIAQKLADQKNIGRVHYKKMYVAGNQKTYPVGDRFEDFVRIDVDRRKIEVAVGADLSNISKLIAVYTRDPLDGIVNIRQLSPDEISGTVFYGRPDFNMPINDAKANPNDPRTWEITNYSRIDSIIPESKYISDNGGILVFEVHFEPKGSNLKGPQSVRFLIPILEQRLGRPVKFISKPGSAEHYAAIASAKPGDIFLIENLRLDPDIAKLEKSPDKKTRDDFVKRLHVGRNANNPSAGVVKINMGLGVMHRGEQASVTGDAGVPMISGMALAKEFKLGTEAIRNAKHPVMIVFAGGPKIEDKIPMFEDIFKNTLTQGDKFFVFGGAAIPFMMIKNPGIELGLSKSLVNAEILAAAQKIVDIADEEGVEIITPEDYVVADRLPADESEQVAMRVVKNIPATMGYYDIGPKTVEMFKKMLLDDKGKSRFGTVIVNGPAGVVEYEQFREGTRGIFEALAKATKAGATTILGGADTGSTVELLGMKAEDFSLVSTGGGAFLELLQGLGIPGVEVLRGKARQYAYKLNPRTVEGFERVRRTVSDYSAANVLGPLMTEEVPVPAVEKLEEPFVDIEKVQEDEQKASFKLTSERKSRDEVELILKFGDDIEVKEIVALHGRDSDISYKVANEVDTKVTPLFSALGNFDLTKKADYERAIDSIKSVREKIVGLFHEDMEAFSHILRMLATLEDKLKSLAESEVKVAKEALSIAKITPSRTTAGGSSTLRLDVVLAGGAEGHFVVPAGTSKGEDEAKTLGVEKDEDYKKVVENLLEIQNEVTNKGLRADQLPEIGQLMLKMGKDKLGAEATLSFQMALAWAAADQKGLQDYEFIRELAPDLASQGVPITAIQDNITNGGAHAENRLDMQEFMIVPIGKTTAESNKMNDEVDRKLGLIYQSLGLKADPDDKGVGALRGKEGGYKIEDLTLEKLADIYAHADSYKIENLDIQALKEQKAGVHEFVLNCQLAAIQNAGYKPSASGEAGTVALALDAAATSMLVDGHNDNDLYNFEGRQITSEELVKIYAGWVKKYPIRSIEDGLGENDWEGWMNLIEAIGDNVLVIGDDLLVTQGGRLSEFIKRLSARGFIDADGKVTKKIGILIKLNQNGFLTTGIDNPEEGYLGTLEVIRLAKKHGISWVVSHRSKEAEPQENEVSIAALAAGTNADALKSGNHVQPVRAVKEDRLAEIDARERAKAASQKKLEPDSPEVLELAWGKKLAPIAVAFPSDINHSLPNQLIDVHYNKQGKVYAILLNHESLLKQGPDGLMALQNYVWRLGEGNIKFVLHINRDDVKPEEADAILDNDLAEINKINENYTESSRNMFSAVATGTNPGDIARQVKEKLGADIYQVFGPESYVEQFSSIAKIKVILDSATPGKFTSMAKALKLIELIPEEGKASPEKLEVLDKLFSQDKEGNFHVKAVEVGKEVLDQVEKYKEEVAAKISI